jgi:hypothetical protein
MKKGIAILLLAVMVFDFTSCTTYKQLSAQQDFEIYQARDHVQVLNIHSKRDSIITFNEKFPGKLANKQVYGLRQMRFPYTTSDSIIFKAQNQNAAFIRSKGVLYKIMSQDKSGFICISSDTIRTPFSEVTQMNVKMKDPGKTTILVLGLSAIVIVTSFYLIRTFWTFDVAY